MGKGGKGIGKGKSNVKSLVKSNAKSFGQPPAPGTRSLKRFESDCVDDVEDMPQAPPPLVTPKQQSWPTVVPAEQYQGTQQCKHQ